MARATELLEYEFLHRVKPGAPDGSHPVQKRVFPPP
jgi:hypothetical protein